VSNTSASGGHLSPQTGIPSITSAEDVIQAVLADCSGLPGDLVRPRWQPRTPATPPQDVDWCAFGITRVTPRGYPVVRHQALGEDDDGGDVVTRQEQLEILVTFYGPEASDRCAALGMALHVPQNRDPLRRAGMAVDGLGDPVIAPERVNQIWVMRVDLTIWITREISSRYPVRSLAKCGGYLIETDSPGHEAG